MTIYALAFFALAAVGVIGTIRAGWGVINPVSVFFAVWSPIVALMVLGVLDVAPLVEATWVVVLVAASSLVIGSIYGGFVAARRGTGNGRPDSDEIPDSDRLTRVYRYAVVALAGYVAIEVVLLLPTLRAAGGLSAIFGGEGEEGIAFRRELQSEAYSASETAFSGGSALLGGFEYVLFLGMISLFLGARYVRRGQALRGLIPLALMAAYSLIALQRFAFVYSLVLFGFAYLYFGERKPPAPHRRRARSRWAIAALCVLLVAVVYIPLEARDPETTPSSAAESVLSYYTGGVASLNVRESGDLRAGEFDRGYGTWSFWGAASIGKRLGAPVELPPNTLPFVNTQTDGVAYSNVYTFLVYFLNDFGLAGVVIMPMLLGFAAGGLHHKVRVRRNLTLVPAAAVVMATITMSFFGLSLIRDVRYLLVAVVSIPILRWVNAGRPLPRLRSPIPARDLA